MLKLFAKPTYRTGWVLHGRRRFATLDVGSDPEARVDTEAPQPRGINSKPDVEKPVSIYHRHRELIRPIIINDAAAALGRRRAARRGAAAHTVRSLESRRDPNDGKAVSLQESSTLTYSIETSMP
ncbi:hypothetical protein EVAR_47040_1 [Eumeta japonica]|uniref:Uncharacterized protein n=1 Tax=Eumeta variegata TaxID=151549 RepID=A0A4C1XHF0_EUMVA|nr:hypothetical protein EVAR_47040_1 [Eumeta japonica]